MGKQNLTLMTDLYELTMMQGYFRNKDRNETVIFDAFYRNNPMDSGYSICAGLEQVIDYINNLHFEDDDIAYLRSLGIFGEDFLKYLRDFHFSGDIYAICQTDWRQFSAAAWSARGATRNKARRRRRSRHAARC